MTLLLSGAFFEEESQKDASWGVLHGSVCVWGRTRRCLTTMSVLASLLRGQGVQTSHGYLLRSSDDVEGVPCPFF